MQQSSGINPSRSFRGIYPSKVTPLGQVLVAFENQQFVGYVTIVWQSEYLAFREDNTPEVVDLNVLPAWQRRGIGSQLMDRAEELVSERSTWVGIGVGLAPGYNAAQKMYVSRGYIPDGLGITYDNKYPQYGETVSVDHSLELHLKKRFGSSIVSDQQDL